MISHEIFSESNKIEAVFTKTEMNIGWDLFSSK